MDKQQSNGCCKDDQKQVKLETDQKAVEVAVFSFYHIGNAVATPFSEYQLTPLDSYSYTHPFSTGPPDATSANLYLVYRVFRI